MCDGTVEVVDATRAEATQHVLVLQQETGRYGRRNVRSYNMSCVVSWEWVRPQGDDDAITKPL